jgi:hypothetical protein
MPEKLLQKKFSASEGQFVTAKQATTVGLKLTEWLNGRHLEISTVEPDGSWAETISSLKDAFGPKTRKTRKSGSRKRDQELTIVKITRQHRKFIWDFAKYCLQSDGFRVY